MILVNRSAVSETGIVSLIHLQYQYTLNDRLVCEILIVIESVCALYAIYCEFLI